MERVSASCLESGLRRLLSCTHSIGLGLGSNSMVGLLSYMTPRMSDKQAAASHLLDAHLLHDILECLNALF